MKHNLIVSIFVLSIAATPVFAGETHHPSDLTAAKSGSAATAQPCNGMGMMQMQGMKPHMDKMNAIAQQYSQVKSAKARRRFMREHMREMRKAMGEMMGKMGSAGMMGGAGKMGKMGGSAAAMSMEKRIKKMQAGMGVMRQMMKQMMDQQSMMMGMPLDMKGR